MAIVKRHDPNDYLRMAAGVLGIHADTKAIELLLNLKELVNEKGGSATIDDIVQMESDVIEMLKQEEDEVNE